MKLPSGDLNPNPYPPHPINTYIYRVTIVLKNIRWSDQF